MFSAEDIQKKLNRRPFIPVRIITSSGQSYVVTHPELAMVGRRTIVVGTASQENPTIYETENSVAVMHVTDIQDVPQANPSPEPSASPSSST